MKPIVNLFLLVWVVAFSGCATTGGGLNVYDGTWSMCKLKTPSGYIVNLPFQTALPIGAETPRGTVVNCKPIPAKPGVAQPATEKISSYDYIPNMKWRWQPKDVTKL